MRDEPGEVRADHGRRLDRDQPRRHRRWSPRPPVDAAIGLVDRLVDEDSEIVTVLVGADAATTDTARLEEHLALAHPHLEVEVHEGGQPLYPYLVGVE